MFHPRLPEFSYTNRHEKVKQENHGREMREGKKIQVE